MNEDTRIFPRYETTNMKIQFSSSALEDVELSVDNVSLGGISVSTNEPITFDPNFKASLKLGTQEFKITAYSVWKESKAEEESSNYNYGFRLVFSEEDHYLRWMTFMKALHHHKKKSASKNS